MSKKNSNLVRYFLKTSPLSRYQAYSSITAPSFHKYPVPVFKSDEEYLADFLNGLEVSGPSSANFTTLKNRTVREHPHFRKIFPSMLIAKIPTAGNEREPQQLSQSIMDVCKKQEEGTIPFQELEQRLEIASPEILAQVRTRLIYLFKLLINKRDKIHPNSLELDANLHLSRAIIAALSRIQNDEQTKQNWRQLEAMEKLMRAREYQKKGLKDIALNNFQEVFKDEAASARTRLQALKVLCTSGQELGDTTVLQSLMSELQSRGDKQYQQMILTSIRKIKQAKE